MRHILLVVLVGLFAASSIAVQAQVAGEPQPILGFFTPDDLPAMPPFIVREVETWYAFYFSGRNNPDWDPTHAALYRCTSGDGLIYGDCVRLKGCDDAVPPFTCGYNFGGLRPWVIKDGPLYHMWVSFYSTSWWNWGIYYTQSSSLDELGSGDWSLATGGPFGTSRQYHSVFQQTGGFLAFYERRRYQDERCLHLSGAETHAWDVIRRTSSDGLNWGLEQEVLFHGCEVQPLPAWHFVVRNPWNGNFLLFYRDPSDWEIGYRTSLDEGMSWSEPHWLPIATPALTLHQDGDRTYLYYGYANDLWRVELCIEDSGAVSVADGSCETGPGVCTGSHPTADAGTDQTVNPGEPATLAGSGSDPDGDLPLTFAWAFVSRPPGSSATLDDPTSTTPAFTADQAGDYTIRLVVTDSRGCSSDPDEVSVSTTNTAPLADAGPDQSILELDTSVRLDGTQSTDDDGDDITFAWTLELRPAGSVASLDDPTSSTPRFTLDRYGSYEIGLVVTDTFGAQSEPDTVIVSSENLPPVADAGANQGVVVGDLVHLDGNGSSDPNQDPLSFEWGFIDRPTGSFVELDDPASPTPSFSVDEPGSYLVGLTVSDGLLSAASEVYVEAITTVEAAQAELLDAISVINELLTPASFDNSNQARALTNKINDVLGSLENGDEAEALEKLESNGVIGKVDGCATVTDVGRCARGFDALPCPDNNDWVDDCAEQALVYDRLKAAIDFLAGAPPS